MNGTPTPPPRDPLAGSVDKRARRLARAKAERRGLLAEAAPLGVLGLVLVLPAVAGAYLGRWLDERAPGYSVRWTVSLILLGLTVGVFNAFKYLRGR